MTTTLPNYAFERQTGTTSSASDESRSASPGSHPHQGATERRNTNALGKHSAVPQRRVNSARGTTSHSKRPSGRNAKGKPSVKPAPHDKRDNRNLKNEQLSGRNARDDESKHDESSEEPPAEMGCQRVDCIAHGICKHGVTCTKDEPHFHKPNQKTGLARRWAENAPSKPSTTKVVCRVVKCKQPANKCDNFACHYHFNRTKYTDSVKSMVAAAAQEILDDTFPQTLDYQAKDFAKNALKDLQSDVEKALTMIPPDQAAGVQIALAEAVDLVTKLKITPIYPPSGDAVSAVSHQPANHALQLTPVAASAPSEAEIVSNDPVHAPPPPPPPPPVAATLSLTPNNSPAQSAASTSSLEDIARGPSTESRPPGDDIEAVSLEDWLATPTPTPTVTTPPPPPVIVDKRGVRTNEIVLFTNDTAPMTASGVGISHRVKRWLHNQGATWIVKTQEWRMRNDEHSTLLPEHFITSPESVSQLCWFWKEIGTTDSVEVAVDLVKGRYRNARIVTVYTDLVELVLFDANLSKCTLLDGDLLSRVAHLRVIELMSNSTHYSACCRNQTVYNNTVGHIENQLHMRGLLRRNHKSNVVVTDHAEEHSSVPFRSGERLPIISPHAPHSKWAVSKPPVTIVTGTTAPSRS